MAKPRSEVFDPYKVGIYHCFTECVRQLFLLGDDLEAMISNKHRRDFILEKLRWLAGRMAIDILDFSLMSNHIHVILRNRPDIVEGWSDREVGERWWALCPQRKNDDGTPADPTDADIAEVLGDADQTADLRMRLSNISWFMWFLLDPIAKLANREDKKRGHFFASRFKCVRLEDEGAILACAIYAVLNPYRAGMCKVPEGYVHSSLALRVQGEMLRHQQELARERGETLDEALPGAPDPDAWLSALFIDWSASALEAELENVGTEEKPKMVPKSNHFPCDRVSDRGYLPLAWDDYLELLRWTAANVRAPRRQETDPTLLAHREQALPANLETLLTCLGVATDQWIDTIQYFPDRFYGFVGTAEQMAVEAQRNSRRWLKGVAECRRRFRGRAKDASDANGGTATSGSDSGS